MAWILVFMGAFVVIGTLGTGRQVFMAGVSCLALIKYLQ